jgi:hypothetical protein
MPLRSRLIELKSEGQRVLVNQDQIIWAQTWEGSVDFNKGKPATQIFFEGHRALTVDQSLDELSALCSDLE